MKVNTLLALQITKSIPAIMAVTQMMNMTPAKTSKVMTKA